MASWRKLDATTVGLFVRYDDRHRAKAIPTARWDAELRCWRVRTFFADEVERLVDELNGTSSSSSSTKPATDLTEAFVSMLTLLPEAQRVAVRRALVRACHPDVGGDTAVMQSLNRAFERIGKTS